MNEQWVMGEWTIYDEDREAQKRKEPYWTLVKGEGGICRGPYGRKATDPEYIVGPTGYEADGIHVDAKALPVLLAAPRMFAVLQEMAKEKDDGGCEGHFGTLAYNALQSAQDKSDG